MLLVSLLYGLTDLVFIVVIDFKVGIVVGPISTANAEGLNTTSKTKTDNSFVLNKPINTHGEIATFAIQSKLNS
jgi:hypothetical protein